MSSVRGQPTSARSVVSTAADVMSEEVLTCREGDSLERAAQLMWDHRCGCLVVVDDDRRPAAMLTDRDVCMAAYTQGKLLSAIPVSVAMSKRLFALHADASLLAAERTMRLHGLRRLPVVDADHVLVGLVSLCDIAAHAQEPPDRARDGLSASAVAQTLADIGHRVRKS